MRWISSRKHEMEIWSYGSLNLWHVETKKLWNPENKKPWNNETNILLFPFEGIPTTRQHTDYHPCTGGTRGSFVDTRELGEPGRPTNDPLICGKVRESQNEFVLFYRESKTIGNRRKTVMHCRVFEYFPKSFQISQYSCVDFGWIIRDKLYRRRPQT